MIAELTALRSAEASELSLRGVPPLRDDEAICALVSQERKSRLLRRAPHPTSPLRTPRNDTVWAFSTVPLEVSAL